jgi:exodeoxyribonuclease VII large subunit
MATGAQTVVGEERPDIVSIAELYNQVDRALAEAFPKNRPVWVRGEVQTCSDRTGHCYVDLVDPDSGRDRAAPVLKVKCWRQTWTPLKVTLHREGIELQPGMVVVLRGVVDFYRPRAEVGFVMTDLDVTALLGRVAAQRAALVEKLRAEGLLDANAALVVPAVPLRIGLVASPGTEGYRDFLTQLERSRLAFSVVLAKASVQGAGAPSAIARSIRRLGAAGCDVVVVVRGGGSKADLAAFDTEPVARAVATAPVAVWTGIGHTGDESVADIVAHRAWHTPTECGKALASVVTEWWEGCVARSADTVARRTFEVLDGATTGARSSRVRLSGSARQQLRRHRAHLDRAALSAARTGRRSTVLARDSLATRRTRVSSSVLGQLARAEDRSAGWRRLLAAYDIDRQLERGYTLTLDADGRRARSARSLGVGDVLVTRFADGAARSVVESTEIGSTEVGSTEIGSTEVGSTETAGADPRGRSDDGR